MKTKTIEKVIKKKLDAWFATITDDNVRALASKNSIVTGGSIASMLLNEKVNDFDIYFRNKETALAVSKYYAKGYPVKVINGADYQNYKANDEVWIDGQRVEDHSQFTLFVKDITPDRVALFMHGVNYYSVTGDGSLMAEQDELDQSGINIFSSINEAKEKVEEGSYKPLFFTANAITLSDQVQLVIRFHGEPEELHKNYDYVHATNYYDSGEGLLYTNKAAIESLLTKELRYIGSLYPLTSVIRSKKFIKRGWSITAGEYLKMLFQVAELDLKDPAVLSTQLIGIDIAFFSILIEVLGNRDTVSHPTVTYPYICEVIDRIFN